MSGYNFTNESMLCTELTFDDIAGNPGAIRERISQAISSLEEVDDSNFDFGEIKPSELEAGDLVYKEGFIGRIAHARRHKSSRSCDGQSYRFYLDYVAGDLAMFKYFRGSICDGCFKGTRAYIQGNANMRWYGMKNGS